jgi:hypothetical protein
MPARAILAGFGFVKTKQFWVIEMCNIVQGLGYFIPQLYLPSMYAWHRAGLQLTTRQQLMPGSIAYHRDHS